VIRITHNITLALLAPGSRIATFRLDPRVKPEANARASRSPANFRDDSKVVSRICKKTLTFISLCTFTQRIVSRACKRIFPLVFLCVLTPFAHAALQPLTSANRAQFMAIEKHVANTQTVSGDFTQTRHIPLLSKPLISSGHFTLSKTKGLGWIQTTPFALTLKVTADKIKQQILKNPPTILTQKQQPIVFAFTHIFLSVFNGDITGVQHYFNIAFEGSPTAWTLQLHPKTFPLNKAISDITLTGARHVKTLRIEDTQHNITDITLSHVSEHA
jgi:outer membrane lipoprotein-sorting protein